MKFNANVLVTSALAVTLLTMGACAPAKSGKRFKDRGGAHNKATVVETEESKAFRDEIIVIDAKIEEATEHEESKEKIDELMKQYLASGVSGLDPVATEDEGTDAPGFRADEPRKRAKYIMSVRVNLSGEGFVDLVGVSESFGNSTALKTLTHVNKDCKTKLANLVVRAGCNDAACSKLLVQIIKKGQTAGGSLQVEEVLKKKVSEDAEVAPGDLKPTLFQELNREADLAKRKVPVKINNEMASCKAAEASGESNKPEVVAEAAPADSAADVVEKGLTE